MSIEQWAEAVESAKADTRQFNQQRRQLPARIEELKNLEKRALAYRAELLQKKAHLLSRLELHEATTSAAEGLLAGNLAARRLLDYWYRAADPAVLKMRPEARELMIVLGTLLAAQYVKDHMKGGRLAGDIPSDVRPWNHIKSFPGLRQAYNLLSDGCPANLVRDYLMRLRVDPEAAPPIPLRGDLKAPVTIQELGFRSEEDASAFFGMAAAGLNFQLPSE